MARKNNRPKWRQEGGRWVATLPNSVEDQLKARRRADREAQIENGTLGKPVAGRTGAHGGGKKEQHRRDRRDSKNRIAYGDWE